MYKTKKGQIMPIEQVDYENQFVERVTFLQLKQGESATVAFLPKVPHMDRPVIKFSQHWISEKTDGNYVMCNKGLCCTVQTWNDRAKAYEVSKPKTVFWVPIVMYYPDPETMEPTAGVGILSLNSFQYSKLVEQTNSCEPGTLPFYERDCSVTFDKNGQYNDYTFIKKEKTARYLENPTMKKTVEEQLETLYDDIINTLPPEFTETEMAKKIDEWNKVKAQRSGQTGETNSVAQSVAAAQQEAPQATVANTTMTPSQAAQQASRQAEATVAKVGADVPTETSAQDIPVEDFSLDELAGVLGTDI